MLFGLDLSPRAAAACKAAAAAAGLAALVAVPLSPAVAGPVGQLSCNVSGGVGFVITSKRALNCVYQPANGARPQHYVGTISRFGLDVGFQGPGKLGWTVFSGGPVVGPGSLAGTYAGGTASVTAGVGVGANALVGGRGGNFTLQPLSVEVQSGINVAAGIGALTLEYMR